MVLCLLFFPCTLLLVISDPVKVRCHHHHGPASAGSVLVHGGMFPQKNSCTRGGGTYLSTPLVFGRNNSSGEAAAYCVFAEMTCATSGTSARRSSCYGMLPLCVCGDYPSSCLGLRALTCWAAFFEPRVVKHLVRGSPYGILLARIAAVVNPTHTLRPIDLLRSFQFGPV